MADRPKVKIILTPEANGKVAIGCHDPQTGREHATGLKVARDEVERIVRHYKDRLEQTGNEVSVREV